MTELRDHNISQFIVSSGLPNLAFLDMTGNQMSYFVRYVLSLDTLILANNNFSGTMSSSVGSMPVLRCVWI